jgi:DNA-binding IclR family transcriptional regulator
VKKENSSSALMRGFAVMERVVNAGQPISSADLAVQLELPKPTVHRIAQQLEEEGILQREPKGKRFMAAPRLRVFAMAVLSNSVLGAPRHAILQSLSEEIQETCNCTMIDGHDLVYFDRVETNWPYRINLPVGTRLPLHCTAGGKLFLANMKPAQRRRMIGMVPLKRHTDRTITDPELLEQELREIKVSGVGVDNEEYMRGLISLAVPVIDRSGRMCFAVAVHSPTARKTIDELRQYLPSLRRAAAALSASECSADHASD